MTMTEQKLPPTVAALAPAVVEPEWHADYMWKQLKKYQPALAGALAVLIRDLGEDWPQREFNVGRPDAVLQAPPLLVAGYDFEPEIAPYRTTDADDCSACDECFDQCRWHRGYSEAQGEWTKRLRDAVKANPNVTVAEVQAAVLLEQQEWCGCSSCRADVEAYRTPERPWWRRTIDRVGTWGRG